MELYYDEDTVFLLHLRGTPCLEEGMKALFIYEEDGNGDFLAKRVITRMGE